MCIHAASGIKSFRTVRTWVQGDSKMPGHMLLIQSDNTFTNWQILIFWAQLLFLTFNVMDFLNDFWHTVHSYWRVIWWLYRIWFRRAYKLGDIFPQVSQVWGVFWWYRLICDCKVAAFFNLQKENVNLTYRQIVYNETGIPCSTFAYNFRSSLKMLQLVSLILIFSLKFFGTYVTNMPVQIQMDLSYMTLKVRVKAKSVLILLRYKNFAG